MGRPGLFICIFVLGAAIEAGAHAITALSVVADFKANGEYSFELGVDVTLVRDAEIEGAVAVANPGAPLSAVEIEEVEAQVREYIVTSLRFHLDEETFEPDFEIEEAGGGGELEGAEPAWGSDGGAPPRKRYAAHAKGTIPGAAAEFLLEATPEAVAPVVFIIFRDGVPTRHSQVLYSGEFSRPVDLGAIRSGEPLPGRKPNAPGAAAATGGDKGQSAGEVEEKAASGRDLVLVIGAGAGAFLLFLLALVLLRGRKRRGNDF